MGEVLPRRCPRFLSHHYLCRFAADPISIDSEGCQHAKIVHKFPRPEDTKILSSHAHSL